MARVVIPSPMRAACGGASLVEAEGGRLKQVIENLCRMHPDLRPLILDESGSLHHHLALFVDGVQVRPGGGLFIEVGEDSEVVIAPSLGGG